MEKKLKHLEFIQLVISRMSVNSFLVKGWTVTLVAAIFALEVKVPSYKYGMLCFIVTAVFWLLDSFFLSQERQYRVLYDVNRIKDEGEIDFDMNAAKYNSGKNRVISCFFSMTLCWFYGTVFVLTAIAFYH